jgi:hypothetical protein
MNLTTGAILVGTLLYMVKHKGADIPGVLLGVAVGVTAPTDGSARSSANSPGC